MFSLMIITNDLVTLGSHCKNDDACSEVEFSKCTDDICKCSFNYTQIDSRLCAPLLGGFCQISDDCVSFNALCIHKICKCPPYFVETSDDKCLPGNMCYNMYREGD